MTSAETAPVAPASGAASPGAEYVVTVQGTTLRVTRRDTPLSPVHPFVLALALVAWVVLAGFGVPGVLWRGLPVLAAAGGAFLVFDPERHRGRRLVRQELVLRVQTGDYRSSAEVDVQVDGQALGGVGDARLVLHRWREPVSDKGGLRLRTELCLVAGGHVYVVAQEVAAPNLAEVEPDGVLRDADATTWKATTVRGLAIALLEASDGRLAVEPSQLEGARLRVYPMVPWPTSVLPMLLVLLEATLLAVHAFATSNAPSNEWGLALYLGLAMLMVLPAPMWWQMARTSACSSSLLRSLYGDVQPFPGRTRWRPWPAFLLAIALPVAFALGWLRLFPQYYPWK